MVYWNDGVNGFESHSSSHVYSKIDDASCEIYGHSCSHDLVNGPEVSIATHSLNDDSFRSANHIPIIAVGHQHHSSFIMDHGPWTMEPRKNRL